MANALKGNATDPEIASIKATIENSGSPQALAGAVNTYLPVLATKLGTYQQRYQQQIPADTNWSPVLPGAQAVFAKHGVSAPGGQSPNPSGGNPAAAQGGYQTGHLYNGLKYLARFPKQQSSWQK